jgi:hypothetical protein
MHAVRPRLAATHDHEPTHSVFSALQSGAAARPRTLGRGAAAAARRGVPARHCWEASICLQLCCHRACARSTEDALTACHKASELNTQLLRAAGKHLHKRSCLLSDLVAATASTSRRVPARCMLTLFAI